MPCWKATCLQTEYASGWHLVAKYILLKPLIDNREHLRLHRSESSIRLLRYSTDCPVSVACLLLYPSLVKLPAMPWKYCNSSLPTLHLLHFTHYQLLPFLPNSWDFLPNSWLFFWSVLSMLWSPIDYPLAFHPPDKGGWLNCLTEVISIANQTFSSFYTSLMKTSSSLSRFCPYKGILDLVD